MPHYEVRRMGKKGVATASAMLCLAAFLSPPGLSANTLQLKLLWQRTFATSIDEFYIDTTSAGEPLIFVLTDGKVHQISVDNQLTTVLEPPEGYDVSVVSDCARFLSYQSSDWSPDMPWSEYVSDFTLLDRNGMQLLKTSAIRAPEQISNTGQPIVDGAWGDTIRMDPMLDWELVFFDAKGQVLNKLPVPGEYCMAFSPVGGMLAVNLWDSVLIAVNEQGSELWRTADWYCTPVFAVANDGTVFDFVDTESDYYARFYGADGAVVSEVVLPSDSLTLAPHLARVASAGRHGLLVANNKLELVSREAEELLWTYSLRTDGATGPYFRDGDISWDGQFVVATVLDDPRGHVVLVLDAAGHLRAEEQVDFGIFVRFVDDTHYFVAAYSRNIGLFRIVK